MIGSLLAPYGLWHLIGAVAVAFLIGVLPVGLFSEMGRQTPLTALIVARRPFGWDGALLFSVLFSVVNLGWFGLNTEVGAQILAGITHTNTVMWDCIVGGVQVLLVLYGMKWLERFYRYTTLLLIVCYAALAAYLVEHYALHTPRQSRPMDWGTALTSVLTFSILAWTYKISTTSRFATPAERTGGLRPGYGLAAPVGIMMAVLVMGVLGLYSQQATGNWNLALLGAHISGWGFVAAVGAALAVIHTNAMNLYPSTVDLLVALNSVRKPRLWEQPLATLGLGIAGTALAIAGILSHVQTLLTDAGDLIIPFTFVMLVDWFVLGRAALPAEDFFDTPNRRRVHLGVSATSAVAVGFVFAFWGQDFLPAFCYTDLPLPVVGGVVGAACYAIFLLLARRGAPDAGRSRLRAG